MKFAGPWDPNNLNNDKNVKKYEKNFKFWQKKC